NRENVERVAQALLKYETLSGDEVNAVIRGESLTRSTVSDLLDSVERDDGVGFARPVRAEPDPHADLGGGAVPQPG
ncbi:MAG: cell division protein FtsH, partial [Planctomycetes bacterium]|nr:cell division protein FtsH [Planctomycetota bacterium]